MALQYPLQLPTEVLELSIHLRVESIQTATTCVGGRATTTMARRGADYAGTSLSLALDKDSLGPPFKVIAPSACPFFCSAQGDGLGTVVLARSGQPDLTDRSRYPDEFPRGSYITATARPDVGSKFQMWAETSACASMKQTVCSFYMNDEIKLVPVFARE